MKNLMQAIILATIALPNLALAQDMDPMKMTCAEFGAMDKEGMMHSVEAMHMAGPDAAMAMDMAATETAMMATMEHCAGQDEMMAMDAMMMQ
jgi:hypothetical protein